jgi:hypothetical protein
MDKYKILYSGDTEYNLPLFLESKVDEMGVMVGFDGGIEQVEQIVNFTYRVSGNTVTVYSSSNTDKFRSLIEQNFTVNWGDGTSSTLPVNNSSNPTQPSVSRTYITSGFYVIKVSLDTPWVKDFVEKKIKVPAINPNVIENELGEFTTVEIPAYSNMTGQTINYLNDLDFTNTTGDTTFRYVGVGGSRLSELKKYGQNEYSNITTGTDQIGSYTGYSFTYTNNSDTMVLTYRDYADNVTMITGSTTGFTQESIFNNMITRNEHFLGFIDEPTIYSDVFVERGKQGVMEKNFRLSEIDNLGELEIYGNGYFNIRKQ